jgi:hypothetical protein
MPGEGSNLSPTTPILTRLPTPSYFLLRPQLLTRISAFARAGLSRRLSASIGRACSPLGDVRLRAGTLVSPLFSTG